MRKYIKGFIFFSSLDTHFGKALLHKVTTYLLCIFFWILVTEVPVSAKKKYTVAIMNLTSVNIPPQYEKIIRNEIEYFFYKSKKFKILEREKIDIVVNEKKIKNAGLKKRNVMISIGKTLAVDYLITGSIELDKKKNVYILKLRIINVSDGSMLYAYSQKFDSISGMKDYTKSFSNNAENDITYFNEHGKVRHGKGRNLLPLLFTITVQPEYFHPLFNFSNIVSGGPGCRVSFGVDNMFVNNLGAFLETGFVSLDSKDNSDYLLIVPLLMKIKYTFHLGRFFFIGPVIKFGPAYLSFRNKNKPDDYNGYVEFMSQAGILFGKKVSKHVSLVMECGYGVFFEENQFLHFLGVNAGVFFVF